jgi:hypothetical protein
MIIHLKNLPKTIQKANPIHSALIKTAKRLQQNMLPTIRLQQVLRDALRWADGGFAQEDPGELEEDGGELGGLEELLGGELVQGEGFGADVDGVGGLAGRGGVHC